MTLNPSYKKGKVNVKANIKFNHNKKYGKISFSGQSVQGSPWKISDVISQMINGYVDVVKDDWIFYLGLTKEAAPIALFLNHAGVNTNTIVYLLKQPIIKEYLKRKVESKSIVKSALYVPEVFAAKIIADELFTEYGAKLTRTTRGHWKKTQDLEK